MIRMAHEIKRSYAITGSMAEGLQGIKKSSV